MTCHYTYRIAQAACFVRKAIRSSIFRSGKLVGEFTSRTLRITIKLVLADIETVKNAHRKKRLRGQTMNATPRSLQ